MGRRAGGDRAMKVLAKVLVLGIAFLVSKVIVFRIGDIRLFYGWAACWLVIMVLVVITECRSRREQ